MQLQSKEIRLALLVLIGSAVGHGQLSAQSARSDDLFARPHVIPLALKIGASELNAMKLDSHAYVRCTVLDGDKSYADVGIHYKGNPEKEAASGKPDFTVTFNKFVARQEFHGYKRLTLQACRDDPSYLAAPIAFEMFQQAGVPAPRTGFARVALNGRDLGLYVFIEGVNRDFLQRHFSQSDGNLYDEGDRTDVTGKLDRDSGKGRDDQADVNALAAAAQLSDPAHRWQQLQRRLDVERFLTFTALEVLLWQKDSYALAARKFRIYHDPVSDRMVFFPKGVERVLEKTDGPAVVSSPSPSKPPSSPTEFGPSGEGGGGGRGPQHLPWKGVVTKALLTTPEGQQRYQETLAKLLDTVFDPDKVRTRARELAVIIRPAVAGADAEAGGKFDAAVTQLCEAVAKRAGVVREQLKTPRGE